MRGWSELAERVGGTTRTSEKTALLARYLVWLNNDELRAAAVFLSGRPFPESDQRAVGLGWAAISAAVTKVASTTAGALGEAYDRSSDLGVAVADVLASRPEEPDPSASPGLVEVAEAFAAMEAASGAPAKGAVFGALLRRCDCVTAKYVVKVLTGELRIGLREGLLEAAIAEAFERPAAEVQLAGMLTGDVGETAVLAKEGRLDEARLRLLHPIKFMLASPAEDAAEIIARLGPTVWVEDKYDGIRAQLHRLGGEARLYSRDLHDISDQFPEIVEAARSLPWDGILDGEVLAYADGHVLPFLTLQARLGRKDPTAKVQADVPVVYVAFDLLAEGPRSAGGGGRDGAAPVEALLAAPLAERRRRLEALDLPTIAEGGRFALSHLVTADSVEALDRVFGEARARRNEGLMVKDPLSGYSPGRRGLGWLKMKRALATLDCVVVGAEAATASATASCRTTRSPSATWPAPVRHDRQGLHGPDRRRDRNDDALVRGAHRPPVRPLPAGRADGRGRGRVRRHPALHAPPVGLRPALPADRPPAPRQERRRDRHAPDGRAAAQPSSRPEPSTWSPPRPAGRRR
jgi:DNA ligase-1